MTRPKPLKRKRAFQLVLLVGTVSIIIRMLLGSELGDTAILYVAIPFGVALALAWLRESAQGAIEPYSYRRFLLDSLIVMLASSVILFEGFLCVLVFMPIYFLMVTLAYVVYRYIKPRRNTPGGKVFSFVVPFVVVMLSLEGTSDSFSFNRSNTVTVSRVVERSVEEIHENLQAPIELEKDRPWFLQIFPMPYEVNAGSLEMGDVHEIHYLYRRWFLANEHKGRALLKIESVNEDHIRTRFVDDTSYISHYLKLHGTDIQLKQLSHNTTRVTLSIDFERSLDPAWYFQPLQRYGVEKMGEFLVAEVIARDGRY